MINRLTLVITFLILSANALFSQWQTIYHPLGVKGLPLVTAMDFKDSQNGFAAGSGYILKTTDSGSSWDTVYTSTSTRFSDIIYIDSISIIAVGSYSGTIVKSIDNGNSWNTTLVSTDLFSSFFTSSSIGYISGSNGDILKTINGGNTWTTLNTNINSDISSIFFVNDSIGFAVGSDKLIKTSDAGNSWRLYNFNDTLGKSFIKMFFPSDSIGYVLNHYNENIYKTMDQGNTWYFLTSLNATFASSLFFINDTTGFFTSKFNISKTTDGGNTWFNQYSISTLGFNFFDDVMDIQMFNSDTGYAVGYGQFYRTYNGGGLTSIQNNYSESQDKLLLYPNPTTNSVKISFSSNNSNNFQIKIFNINGSLVKIKEAISLENIHIDVSDFPKGVYLVQAIMDDGNIYNKKLIISN